MINTGDLIWIFEYATYFADQFSGEGDVFSDFQRGGQRFWAICNKNPWRKSKELTPMQGFQKKPGLPPPIKIMCFSPIPMIFQPLGFSNGGCMKTSIVWMVVGIWGKSYWQKRKNLSGQWKPYFTTWWWITTLLKNSYAPVKSGIISPKNLLKVKEIWHFFKIEAAFVAKSFGEDVEYRIVPLQARLPCLVAIHSTTVRDTTSRDRVTLLKFCCMEPRQKVLLWCWKHMKKVNLGLLGES